MNISHTFVELPSATSLLMAAIALFGGVAYRQLGVSDLPNVDFPTLLVTAALPGASPTRGCTEEGWGPRTDATEFVFHSRGWEVNSRQTADPVADSSSL
jgi:hypothetical protein